MSNRIDQLFKTKLANHRVPPSPDAWSKIENGLLKKNNSPLIWWAAAVFLLFVLGGGVWMSLTSYDQTSPTLSQNTPTVPSVAVDTSKQVANATNSKQTTQQITTVAEKKGRPVQKQKSTIQQVEEKDPLSTEPIVTSIETPENVKTETLTNVAIAAAEKPIVIEFILEPVPSTTVAQNEESEKSGFQKILKKARDVKNGESDLGFREAKNDLFAFGKKDKTKRNY